MPPKKKEEFGEAKFEFPDGSWYDGKYMLKAPADGKRSPAATTNTSPSATDIAPHIQHESGTYHDCSGAVYSGQWKEGTATGRGYLVLPQGFTYEGNFADNAFHGTGKYTWPDGSHYEGEWDNNLMNGEGTYTDCSGRRWRGRFVNGVGDNLLPELQL